MRVIELEALNETLEREWKEANRTLNDLIRRIEQLNHQKESINFALASMAIDRYISDGSQLASLQSRLEVHLDSTRNLEQLCLYTGSFTPPPTTLYFTVVSLEEELIEYNKTVESLKAEKIGLQKLLKGVEHKEKRTTGDEISPSGVPEDNKVEYHLKTLRDKKTALEIELLHEYDKHEILAKIQAEKTEALDELAKRLTSHSATLEKLNQIQTEIATQKHNYEELNTEKDKFSRILQRKERDLAKAESKARADGIPEELWIHEKVKITDELSSLEGAMKELNSKLSQQKKQVADLQTQLRLSKVSFGGRTMRSTAQLRSQQTSTPTTEEEERLQLEAIQELAATIVSVEHEIIEKDEMIRNLEQNLHAIHARSQAEETDFTQHMATTSQRNLVLKQRLSSLNSSNTAPPPLRTTTPTTTSTATNRGTSAKTTKPMASPTTAASPRRSFHQSQQQQISRTSNSRRNVTTNYQRQLPSRSSSSSAL
ncbi:hypothetical protein Pelo_497 [Pelomyxa schiedti]|nr:hypothetical protein Pelo_497 [Pelomyxa schiedti]